MPENESITPQEVLMNCLADADRLEHVLVIAYTKEQYYEYWSNELPSHVRLGLIKIAELRINKGVEVSEDAS